MRSQLLVLSMISLAVAASGCGKDVERNALATVEPQQIQTGTINVVQPVPAETRAGLCMDPIETSFKKISRFSDFAMATGRYELKAFQGVGSAVQGPSSAISVVSGAVAEGGVLEYTEICRDLNAMPNSAYNWNVSAPGNIDAKSGSIAEELRLGQTVFGPAVLDMSGAPQLPTRILGMEPATGCTTVDQVFEGAVCPAADFYQIDPNTIGVLRTVDRLVDGINIRSKIFAKYTLVGGEAPKSTPVPNSKKKSKKAPVSKAPANAPNTSPHKNGNQGGDGDQGGSKSGEQGSTPNTNANANANAPAPAPSVPTPKAEKTVVVVNSKVKADIKVKSNAHTGVSKEKMDLKVKEQTIDGNSKTKLDTKSKENTQTGVSKEKLDLKVKESTPEGNSKLKVDEKSKSNEQTGVSKEKLSVKEKENTPTSSSKTKLSIKVKKN